MPDTVYGMAIGDYGAAAICKRGHIESQDIEWHSPSDRCPICGAQVLTACPVCDRRIRGVYKASGIAASVYDRPDFCDKCGGAFPWVGRTARIYELQNRLDEEQLDSATELVVREQLEALTNPDLDDDEQIKRWKRIASAAPGFMQKTASSPLVASLLTAYMKKELGLPPT